ncbi:metal-dependent transcriptional regulator [Clostridium sp. AM58-1XD]|uniref:metal-dependent transcriptional regulator n=1 Tax=Clostridium sp. AM58-1XD TaxID=2292307 RepID=UPI000E520C36|nr:metal-dependent transcriptional regulator [Clostridium sp. AM58-1XD]RGY99593.1 metal-dependent transcriptional regulator [Clostridium sp. AM58-1XD]
MKIQESAENYLETIFMLSRKKPNVRSIDIANELEFSKPSVSVAMKNLRENGYIKIDENGFITLTNEGMKIAETMYERHTTLSQWLMYLGVDEKTAVEDACRIEHVVSDESFQAIKSHIAKMNEFIKE